MIIYIVFHFKKQFVQSILQKNVFHWPFLLFILQKLEDICHSIDKVI